MSANSTTLFALSLFAQICFGAAEFLPTTSDAQKLQEQVQLIQSLLPWSQRNRVELIWTQHQSLNALKERFPDFSNWAQSKPDPITILVSKKSFKNELSYVLRSDQFSALKQEVLGQLRELISKRQLESNTEELLKNLYDQVYHRIGETLLGGSDSIRGLITGILQTVPPEKRVAIFKAGDPSIQIRMIRELEITEQQFKTGGFQHARFGLNSEISLKEILQYLDAKVNSHHAFLVQFGLLAIFNRLSANDLETMTHGHLPNEIDSKIKDTDYNFLEKTESSNLIQLEFELSKRFPDHISKFSTLLSQFVSAIPKQWFEKKVMPLESNTPVLKIVEVHPYLAVYRGCIGGDCSTSHSPMFPFSPWEHDFYIMLPDNTFVGYVSATRVMAEGKPAFYVKDITGKNMSAEQAEAILHAFSKIYNYYGASQYIIARAEFTDIENHYPILKSAIAKFNRGANINSVNISFPDEQIREFIQSDRRFSSGSPYDSTRYHPSGAVFVGNENFFEQHTVSYRKGTLSSIQPQTPKQSLLFALRMLVADEKANISMVPGVNENEIIQIFQALKNPSRLSVTQYYSEISRIFQRFGIELTKSFRQDHESFFLEGHILAADAFTQSEFSESEKLFVAYCRRVKNFEIIDKALNSSPSLDRLNESKRLNDLVDLFRQRAENIDIALLGLFANHGVKSAERALTQPEIQAKLEFAVNEFIFGGRLDGVTQAVTKSGLLGIKVLIDHIQSWSIEVAQTQMNSNLGKLGLSYENIRNSELKINLDSALFASQNASEFSDIRRLLTSVAKKFEGKIIPFDRYYLSILKIADQYPKLLHESGFIESRLKYFRQADSNDTAAAAEAYLLKNLSKDVAKFIQSGRLAPAMAQLVSGFLQSNRGGVLHPHLSLASDWISSGKIKSDKKSGLQAFWNFAAKLEDVTSGNILDLQLSAKNFGLTMKDLLGNAEFRERITDLLLDQPASYWATSKDDPSELSKHAIAMNLWAMRMIAGNTRFANYPLYYNPKIKESGEYWKAYNKIVAAANDGSETASLALMNLVNQNQVFDLNNLSEQILISWVEASSGQAKMFAMIELSKRNTRFQFEDHHIDFASKNWYRFSNSGLRRETENSREFKLAVGLADFLIKFQAKDVAIQKQTANIALSISRQSYPLDIGLKAFLIFIKNGGNRESISSYQLEYMISKIVANPLTSDTQRLLAMYRSMTLTSTPKHILLCRTLFKN